MAGPRDDRRRAAPAQAGSGRGGSEGRGDAPIDAAEFAALVEPLLATDGPAAAFAVAVSGGPDSMALLRLAAAYAQASERRAVALTVDHRLRPEAAAEARFVAETARGLGLEHHTLSWDGPKPAANLQAAARTARYGLMRAWRRQAGVGPLLVAHTQDDVAETFLLRLARGSGVDGLAAMGAAVLEDAAIDPPLRLLRPLLGVPRLRLIATLEAHGQGWAEDPSNADLRFDRARARQALDALGPLGVTPERLARTAAAMGRARSVLERETDLLLASAALEDADLGAVALDRERLLAAPEEVGLRAFARALEWVSGADYPPRFDGLARAFAALAEPAPARTFSGALIETTPDAVKLWREEAAAAAPRALAEGAPRDWDGRFRVKADRPGLRVGPLGAAGATAVAARPDLTQSSRFWSTAPASARRAACAVFYGGDPIACPAAGLRLHDVTITPLRARPLSRPLDVWRDGEDGETPVTLE